MFNKHHIKEWNTLGGKTKTKHKALINFKFPELNSNKMIKH